MDSEWLWSVVVDVRCVVFSLNLKHVQGKLGIMRSLGQEMLFVVAVVTKQYNAEHTDCLGPGNLVCYIRSFVMISDPFITSFHCIP